MYDVQGPKCAVLSTDYWVSAKCTVLDTYIACIADFVRPTHATWTAELEHVVGVEVRERERESSCSLLISSNFIILVRVASSTACSTCCKQPIWPLQIPLK